MAFLEILITILIAVVIGVLFYYLFKSTGPWGSLWTFLLILILAGITAEAWIEPVGPVVYDVAWVPTLFVVLIFALLLAAASPPRDRRIERPAGTEPYEEENAAVAIGAFFWIFLMLIFLFALWGIFVKL